MQLWIILLGVSLNYLENYAIEFPNFDDHRCARECDGSCMVCEYNLTIEIMFTLEAKHCKQTNSSEHCITADNTQTMVTVANRQMPGPLIQVCNGDQVKVNVINRLPDQSTTIHWHGQHQVYTPYMDGVPMITQCPIPPPTSFQYHFIATQSGTHMYHGHSGLQRASGLFGGLIVRDMPEDNKIAELYDFDEPDHMILVTEWIHNPMEYHYKLERLGKSTQTTFPILVNGYSNKRKIFRNTAPIFEVKQNGRYRFRLVHAGVIGCTISLTIKNHDMRVVSTDGADINETTVKKITITPGERIDFILDAKQKHGTSHTMNFQGSFLCSKSSTKATLKYTDKTNSTNKLDDSSSINHLEFNCINKNQDGKSCVSYQDLRAVEKMDDSLKGKPDFKYIISFNTVIHRLKAFKDSSALVPMVPVFNNISFRMPTTNLLDSDVGDVTFCNKENLNGCTDKVCECTHVIEIPMYSLVELILVAETFPFMIHPIHLHGYSFRVLANEKLPGKVTYNCIEEMDAKGQLKRNFEDPPLKDTLSTPTGGYSIIRFNASNAGYWIMHCHIDTHMDVGMALVIKVGDPEKPPVDFPKCKNYVNNEIFGETCLVEGESEGENLNNY